MLAYVPSYEVRTPKNLKEALAVLQKNPGVYKPLAGGTDLMVLYEAGKLPPGQYLNIWGLPELSKIDAKKTEIILGGLLTFTKIQENPIIQKEFPLLVLAAKEIGAVAIQNRATIAGNIVNASPAADSPPALLVYDADIELTSAAGVRWLPYSEFHLGYKKTALQPGELLTHIRLRRGEKLSSQYFRKVGTRKAQAISKVCFAGVTKIEKGKINLARIALGSVAPLPLRCKNAEKSLQDQSLKTILSVAGIKECQAALMKDIAPIDDIRSTRRYRETVSQNLLLEFLRALG